MRAVAEKVHGNRSWRRRGAIAVLLLCGALPIASSAADPANGNRLYFSHCVGCHGVGGKSANPNAPNLVGGEKLMQADTALLMRLKTGKNQCPPFLGILKDKDMLDVIAFIRTLR